MTASPSPQFWNGKRVLVTGHTGFKGAWLSLWLDQLGAKVTGLALPPDDDVSLFAHAELGNSVDSRFSDIRDQNAVMDVVADSRPEVIFHLAAQSLVRPSYEDPVGTYATNVMGTINLMEASRHSGCVETFINVTSDKCYENFEWERPYHEDDRMGGYDPYSSSKGCSELITSAYRRSFFQSAGETTSVALASARAGNVIGGGDWSRDRLIPDCVNALLDGRPILIRNPHAVRPWQHVLEPLSGYLQLAEKMAKNRTAYADAWNFGPDSQDAQTVQWIVEQMTRSWGGKATWELQTGDHPHEATFLRVDTAKAQQHLDWHPRLDAASAVAWTAQWYRDQSAGADARELCFEQIQQYQDISSGQ